METNNKFNIINNIDGQEMLYINSQYLSDCIKYLYENNLRFIAISSFHNYLLDNLNFLIEHKDFIEGLSILDDKWDLSILNHLHKLKYIGVPDNGKDLIDLKNFPNLEVAGVTFSPRLKGLEHCNKLKSLTLSNYISKFGDLTELPFISNLEHLSLIKPSISTLNGIDKFTKINKLEIFDAPKLQKLEMIYNLSLCLEELEFEKCKHIKDYEVLGKLINLKKLIILESGQIPSLSFVNNLKNLSFLSFYGTNVLDGNIEYCAGINYVGFDNKRHYSRKQGNSIKISK